MKIDNIFNIGDMVCFIEDNQLKQGTISTIETYSSLENGLVITELQYGVYCNNDDRTIAIEQEHLAFLPITEIQE